MDVELIRPLTANQGRCIEFLVRGHSISATAKMLNIGRSTIHKWKNQPEFKAALEHGRHEVIESAIDTTRAAYRLAVVHLHRVVSTEEGTAIEGETTPVTPERRDRCAQILVNACLRAGGLQTVNSESISDQRSMKDYLLELAERSPESSGDWDQEGS